MLGLTMSGGFWWRRVLRRLGLIALRLSTASTLGLSLGAAVCAVSWSTVCWAAEPTAADIQVARRLFQRATADEELGRWESALKTLREVEAIKVTAGVLFHIAVCEQNLGRYVEALNDLGRAEELAQVNRDTAVLDLIPERRKQIESMIGHLRIELIGASDGLEGVDVRIDGQRISAAALRVDIPLNPTLHTIALLRPGKPTITREVTVQSGSRQTERFDITPEKPTVTAEYADGQPPAHPARSDPTVTKKVVMYSAYALGLAGIGAGIYFVLDANKYDDSAGLARLDIADAIQGLEQTNYPVFQPGQECSGPFDVGMSSTQLALQGQRRDACADLRGAVQHRDRSQTLAIWSFAIAGAGAIGGTAVLLFWPEPKDKQNTASVHIAPTLGGATIFGNF